MAIWNQKDKKFKKKEDKKSDKDDTATIDKKSNDTWVNQSEIKAQSASPTIDESSTSQEKSEQHTDIVEKLERLGNLKQKGIITDEEFQKIKSGYLEMFSKEVLARNKLLSEKKEGNRENNR